MKLLIAILLTIGFISPVLAENCTKSRDYILDGLAGDLPKPPKTYQDLFKVCIETLEFPNVQDAYILKDGAIAIRPKRNTVLATAETLFQFCRQFPSRTARFLTLREQRMQPTVGLLVMMSSGGATPCRSIHSPS
jgi:hypothetical protein